MKVEFFLDPYGIPRARTSEGNELIGAFLEEDVQGSIYYCELIMSEIKRVEGEPDGFWEGTGNAHTLTLTNVSARIEGEFVQPRQHICLPLEEFKCIIASWCVFVQSKSEAVE